MALDRPSYDRLAAADCSGDAAFVMQSLRCFFDPACTLPSFEPGVSPANVYEVARLNKVTNFVERICRSPDLPQDGQFQATLQRYRARTASLNAVSLADTLAVYKALGGRGIDFVFFKGPVQQGLIYSDHFMKPAGDVDVLVSPADFATAREALAEIGYKVSEMSRSRWWITFLGEQHLTRKAQRTSVVDLHQRLQQPGSPSPRDTDSFIRRKRNVDAAGTVVPFISAQDVVLLASISVAKALYNREACAGYACDVRAGMQAMSGDEREGLLRHAESQGLADTLLLGIRSADLLLANSAGPLSDLARLACPGIRDDDLRDMVLAPWSQRIRWPHRRDMLWQLCGRKPARYVSEITWAASAEVVRRIFERPAPEATANQFKEHA